MSLNIELAEKVLSHIEHDPDSHYQGSWINECGTTACIAGHAMLASGQYVRRQSEYSELVHLVHKDTGKLAEPVIDGARLLGLTSDDATNIFMEMDEDVAIRKLRNKITEAKHAAASTPTDGDNA